MQIRTADFVDREQALASFEKCLQGGAQGALAFQAPIGLGKSFLLRELRLQCDAAHIRAVFAETACETVPNHWHILSLLATELSDALPQTIAVLNRIESRTGPLERLPGGGIVITGGNVNVAGDLVGGQKLVVESDAQAREYRGWDLQLERAFYADLTQVCRAGAADGGNARVWVLLFDNVDQATKETCNWLAKLLRRMWAGDLPGLLIVMTGEILPPDLAKAADVCLDQCTLDSFRQVDVEQYFLRLGVPMEMGANAFLFSQGNPALLKVIATNALKGLQR